jgi:hypothetical protein
VLRTIGVCVAAKLTKEVLKQLNEAWLKSYCKEEPNYNPLDILRTDDTDEFEKKLVWLLTQPDYFAFLVKYIFNVELLPFQVVILTELWKRKFPMLIATRGGSKSFLLALYALMRCIIMPNRKVIIAGAAFRQSRFVHEYMETIWKSAPILRDLCDQDSGPTRSTDMCRMTLNGSTVTSIPIGTGEKIRGYRCQDLLAEEFGSHTREIFETVLAGFGNVSASPAEVVKSRAARNMAIAEGIDTDLFSKNPFGHTGNQIVICGTATYDFNHFAEYWKKYKSIIHSKGNTRELAKLFPDGVENGFDWKDYSIIRLPYESLPEGFMDEGNVARSKASVHSGIFQMEFSACVDGNTLITTTKGTKRIIDIEIGDLVLTHKGRFRKVIKKTFLYQSDKILEFDAYGCFQNLRITTNHPLYNGENTFLAAYEESKKLSLSRVTELSGLISVDIADRTHDYIVKEDYIYPRSSKNLLNNHITQQIINMSKLGTSVKEIASSLGISESCIYELRYAKRPKRAIKRFISLDYNAGLLFGYYVSEGSGSDSRSISFAMDSHEDVPLISMIKELEQSIVSTFNTYFKIYDGNDNTSNVFICSRIVYDFIKSVCPGVCYDKIMEHDILFSNPEFMKGYIVGIFNGDGHKNKDFAIISMTNLDIINQLKLVLSYFGIACGIYKKEQTITKFKDKEYLAAEVFSLAVRGLNYRKFLSIFYPEYDTTAPMSAKIICDDECAVSQIKKKQLIPYNSLVYNLEIEEDNSYSTLNATMHNCFCKDSKGFFKRSMLERCVANATNEIHLPEGQVVYDALIKGRTDRRYVIGIDPASEIDNFCIVVIELHMDHRRIVHCWTTTKDSHKERVKLGLTTEDNFYSYCARRIRDLMQVFPTERIMMDSQGGGIAVSEALHETSNLAPGELPIWPVIDETKEKDTDDLAGLHLIEMVNFAKAEWTSEANHGMRKDFEDRVLLFPKFDPIVLSLSAEQDSLNNKLYDTLEDCVMEIEEMKNELVLIEITQTATGRDKWDTPEIKVSGSKKGKMRKDRYSALLMANMGARNISLVEAAQYMSYGGFAEHASIENKKEPAEFIGPAWFTAGIANVY